MQIDLKKWMPAVLGLMLAAPVVPAAAQSRDVGRQMEAEYGVVTPDTGEGRRLNSQLDRVVERIVGGVNQEHPGKRFRLRSATILGGRDSKHDRVVNAFALPDGRIYVTYGLMHLIENDPDQQDELAFVVGHEVTHVVERHSAEQNRKSLPWYIGAMVVGAATRSDVAGGLAQYGAAAASAHYSRDDEYRADRGGLLAMNAAGYDPRGATDMLRRLKQAGGEQNSLINGWFGSHPLTQNRVDRIQKMIRDLNGGQDIRGRSGKEYDRQDRGRPDRDRYDRDQYDRNQYDRDPYGRDRDDRDR